VDWQRWIAAAIALLAGAWAAWKIGGPLIRSFRAQKPDAKSGDACGGCGNCGTKSPAQQNGTHDATKP
jgi:hypothetical protein